MTPDMPDPSATDRSTPVAPLAAAAEFVALIARAGVYDDEPDGVYVWDDVQPLARQVRAARRWMEEHGHDWTDDKWHAEEYDDEEQA